MEISEETRRQQRASAEEMQVYKELIHEYIHCYRFFSYMVYRRTCGMFNSSIRRISYADCFSPLYHACFWDFTCHNPQ